MKNVLLKNKKFMFLRVSVKLFYKECIVENEQWKNVFFEKE